MKYQIVLQHSEEDCGAACIATVAKHYGRTFALNRVREAVGTGSRGTTLLGLSRGADALGFNVRQVKATPKLIDRLNEVPLPAIIHWKGYHWVVLYGQKRNKYAIADPGVGIRYLTREELIKGWGNGVMLLLVPDDNRFYEQPDEKIGGFGRYLKRVWPYRFILAQAIAINFAVGLLSLASPLMMQLLTDDVLVRGDTQLLTTVAIGVIAMNLFRSVVGLVQSHLIGHFGQRLQLGLILEYGRKLLRLPLSYFEGRRSGEVVSRIADVNAINTLVSQIVLGLPSQFFIAALSLSVMLFYSWGLTLASLAAFVVVTGVNLLFLPALRQKTRNMIVLGTENQGFLVETFRGVQILKTTQATPQAWQEYQTNYGRAVAKAKAELSGRSRDYLDRQLTANADVREASAHIRIAQSELQKGQAELSLAQANLKATEASLGAARSKRNRYESVAKVGALSQDQFEEAQLSVEQQEQAVLGQKAAVLAQIQTIQRLESEISAAAAKRQRAIAALNPSNAEVAIAIEHIAQEKATGEASIATLNKERSALIQQRIEIHKQLERDSRELQQVEIDLKKTTITATADGIISKLNLRNPGQTVPSGEEIAQIVPSNAPLVVKAAVAPEDKSKLKEGQNVQVRVSACPYPDYGTLKGVVSQISSDTIKPQGNSVTTEVITSGQNGQAATAFYEVTIAPESLLLSRGKNQCTIQLGMEGRADIISREETVLKFLLRKARLSADF